MDESRKEYMVAVELSEPSEFGGYMLHTLTLRRSPNQYHDDLGAISLQTLDCRASASVPNLDSRD